MYLSGLLRQSFSPRCVSDLERLGLYPFLLPNRLVRGLEKWTQRLGGNSATY